MAAFFVELAGAFDMAPHQGILYKLANMGITGHILAWVKDFLIGRSYRVAVGVPLLRHTLYEEACRRDLSLAQSSSMSSYQIFILHHTHIS